MNGWMNAQLSQCIGHSWWIHLKRMEWVNEQLICSFTSKGDSVPINSHTPFLLKLLALLLLLLLSQFSHVRLCATPSPGFSRQEHWSGLPFPSLMHKSEKWKWSGSAMSDSSQPHGMQHTRLLCPWDFPGKSTGVEAITFSVFWP